VSAELPTWVRELDMALPVYPQILLTGNVRDEYLLPPEQDPGSPAPGDDAARPHPYCLVDVIERVCCQREFGTFAVHDVVQNRVNPWSIDEQPDQLPPALAELTADERPRAAPAGGGPPEQEDPPSLAALRRVLMEVVAHRGRAIALVFPYAGRLGSPRAELGDEGRSFFAAAEALAYEAQEVPGPRPVMPYNTVFWVVERQEELPAEFVAGSRAIRIINIPLPPQDQRLAAATHAVSTLLQATGQPDPGPERLSAAADALMSATHGMGNAEVLAIGRMALDRGLPIERLEEAARLYRIGVVDNPWAASSMRQKIVDLERRLNATVLGQRDAVRRTTDIFMRSAAGLTGAQAASSPNRPRGVLFLSGPTGVGKTELAKGIARLILGTEADPIRFDMSEFAGEHARDRLIGAPPGYVGHDAGGELTNRVRANPMSVLLFDEIDKAHPALYDLFLQILEDGRLTDGRGATVYFTECVLVFTSNLGVADKDGQGAVRRTLTYRDDPDEVRRVLRQAFEDFFDREIRRPELRNRFGDSFIAMSFIQPETVPAILDRSLDSVARRMAERHHARLEIGPDARKILEEQSIERLDHGGRGVNNAVEAALVNPLSRQVFDQPPQPGDTITVSRIEQDGHGWRIEVQVCPA
jgi:Cdc48 subfamily AAA family protein/ClpA/ClpB-like protein